MSRVCIELRLQTFSWGGVLVCFCDQCTSEVLLLCKQEQCFSNVAKFHSQEINRLLEPASYKRLVLGANKMAISVKFWLHVYACFIINKELCIHMYSRNKVPSINPF
jgi:hypothetical protein